MSDLMKQALYVTGNFWRVTVASKANKQAAKERVN